MDLTQYVRKTELARNTHRIIREVMRGYTTVVESHGQAEVAIVDIIDYRILRALISYFTQEPIPLKDEEITDEAFDNIKDEQERDKRIFACYMAEFISLSKAAELLNLPVIDLRLRLARLGVPLRLGASSIEELDKEVRNARALARRSSK